MFKFEQNKTYFIKKGKKIKSFYVTGRTVISLKRKMPFEHLYYKDDKGNHSRHKIYSNSETELIFPKGKKHINYILFAKNSC